MTKKLFRVEQLIFYSIILFLPTQLGKHFWPDFSYVLGIRIDYLSPTVYVTDVLMALLFFSWGISQLILLRNKFEIFNFQFLIKNKNSLQITNYKLQITLLLFILSLVFGIWLSKSPSAGWYGLVRIFEFLFLGFYVANSSKKTLTKLPFLFAAGVLFESFLTIAQFLNSGSIGGIMYFFGERAFNSQTPGIANASIGGELFLRPYGTFSHPNVLAGYLTIAMAMVISNIPASQRGEQYQISNIKKIFFVSSVLLGTVALLLTMSRVAIVLWIICLFIFLFRSWNKNLRKKNFIIHNSLSIILIVILGVILFTPLSLRFSDFSLTDQSVTIRSFLIDTALLMVQKSPIFGIGLYNFLHELPSVVRPPLSLPPYTYLQPVHNIYLLTLAQTGIVGLVFFVWFVRKTYQRIRNQESGIRKKRLVILNSNFLLLSLVLILGLFDHYFLTLQQGQMLFALVFGFLWADTV